MNCEIIMFLFSRRLKNVDTETNVERSPVAEDRNFVCAVGRNLDDDKRIGIGEKMPHRQEPCGSRGPRRGYFLWLRSPCQRLLRSTV